MLIRFVVIFFLIAFELHAQPYQLNIVYTNTFTEKPPIINYPKQFATIEACNKYVANLPLLLHAQGFISAAIDSVQQTNLTTTVFIFLGRKYFWKQLHVEEEDKIYLQQAGIKLSNFSAATFNPTIVNLLQEKLLNFFEEKGYPFATVGFDSLHIEENMVSGKLMINKGIAYKMDSIRISGNAKINKTFLYRYLQMPPKSLYQKQKISLIDNKLQDLPFLEVIQPHQLTMLGTGFITDVFLNNKKSNQVDAIIGFLPNNQQINGNLLLTVDANLKLQNAFANGETIGLLWQQIQPKSPRINILYNQPFLFNAAFGLDFNFNLFKRDSSFLNIQSAIGTTYNIGLRSMLKMMFKSARTNLLEVDTNLVKLTKRLPADADVSVNSIAVEYNVNTTNYKLNPRSGTNLVLFTAAGARTIRKNNTITQIKDPNFNYTTLYDTVQLQSYQLKSTLKLEQYWPLAKYATIKTALNGGLVLSPTVYRNEQYQIGGFKLLRGFDEESIFTDKFFVATIEYRYLFGQNAFFNVFTDVGKAYNSIIKNNSSYWGAGAGFSFETKQGIINLTLATGKRDNENFNLRQAKIHIGFVSLF